MVNNKEDLAERKKGVLALYLMGNSPEKISNKLAAPVKTIRRDLRAMGIRATEDTKKDEEQIVQEVMQEFEILKQECWGLYTGTKSLEEKLNIISEIREIATRKAELVELMGIIPLAETRAQSGAGVWKEVKEAFLGNGKPAEAKAQKNPEPAEKVSEKKEAVSILEEEKPTKNKESFEKPVPCPKRDAEEIEVVELDEIKKQATKKADKPAKDKTQKSEEKATAVSIKA
jgi:hypothetical protein